jgi:MinD superfamily P-loop ATPase
VLEVAVLEVAVLDRLCSIGCARSAVLEVAVLDSLPGARCPVSRTVGLAPWALRRVPRTVAQGSQSPIL